MKLVYIAGPYTASSRFGVARNVHTAKAGAREVVRLGAFPVPPHVMGQDIEDEAGGDYWYAGTLEVMRRCDAVLLVGDWESSVGACNEAVVAEHAGMPVFDSLDTLARWLAAVSL